MSSLAIALRRSVEKSAEAFGFSYSSVLLMSNTVVNLGSGFVFWVVASRFVPTESIGIAAALIALAGFLALIGRLGLDVSAVSLVHRHDPTEVANAALTWSFMPAAVLGLAAGAAAAYVRPDASPLAQALAQNILYVVILSSGMSVHQVVDNILLSLGASFAIVIKNATFAVIKLILLLLPPFFATNTILFAWAAGIYLAIALAVAFQIRPLIRGYRPRLVWRPGVLLRERGLVTSNMISASAWAAPALIFPSIVLSVGGPEPAAYFYIAWMIPGILSTIPNSASQALFADLSRTAGVLARPRRRILSALAATVAGAAVLALAAHPILSLFGANYAVGGTTALRFICIGVVLMGFNTFYLIILRHTRKNAGASSYAVSLTLATVGLGVVGLHLWSIDGLALGWMIGQFGGAIVAIFGVMRWLKSLNGAMAVGD